MKCDRLDLRSMEAKTWVYRLKIALYGVKKGPKTWNKRIDCLVPARIFPLCSSSWCLCGGAEQS